MRKAGPLLMPNDERKTPTFLFDALDAKFCFTVDAAASSENALVSNYWTRGDDGLKQDWRDHIVWCNPPYSRDQLCWWVHKAIDSAPSATTVMLLPGDCSTKAGQLALRHAITILFLDRCLAFDDEPAGAKFCSWIVVFGGDRLSARASLASLNLGIVF